MSKKKIAAVLSALAIAAGLYYGVPPSVTEPILCKVFTSTCEK